MKLYSLEERKKLIGITFRDTVKYLTNFYPVYTSVLKVFLNTVDINESPLGVSDEVMIFM